MKKYYIIPYTKNLSAEEKVIRFTYDFSPATSEARRYWTNTWRLKLKNPGQAEASFTANIKERLLSIHSNSE